MMKHLFIFLFMLVICLCNGCSTLQKKGYSVNEHYVILNTHKYMIFVSFKSLTIDQKKSACDLIAAIRYIEEANNNIQINPTNLTSDKDLFIMELWDSKIEGLLRKRIPIFFNKEKMYEGKYSLKYVRTPFGGKCLDVINKRGEKLYSIPIFIG